MPSTKLQVLCHCTEAMPWYSQMVDRHHTSPTPQPGERYGSVGCGKTMSMDIFQSSLQDNAALRVQRLGCRKPERIIVFRTVDYDFQDSFLY